MQTICAIATPRGVGGIGVIRVSGDKAVEICDSVIRCRVRLTEARPNHAYFAKIVDGDDVVDEIMVTVFRAPASFTGEDTVELSCHGGMYLLDRVLRLLLRQGCVPAQPGEYTKRAFLNGKLDLTQAEAVIDLIHAQSKLQASSALRQLDGHLGRKIESQRAKLMEVNTEIMAYVDYPEETIGEIDEDSIYQRLKEVSGALTRMLQSFETGQVIREGIPTAIVGRPNAGKSTLMNALLGKDKSIVTDIAGTTRDLVEDSAVVGDLVLHLIDTAGIRATEDTVEKIGVERARRAAESAGLVLAVVDVSRPLSEEDQEIFKLCEGKTAILVCNKSDLETQADLGDLPFEHIVTLSAKQETGLDELSRMITDLFMKEDIGEDVVTNARQCAALERASNSTESAVRAIEAGFTPDLVSVDISHAAEALGELMGKEVKEQMIEDIFSRFCVGK